MSNRGLRWVGAVAGVPVAVLAAWLVFRWGGGYATRVADDVGLLLLAMFAAGSCVVAAARAVGRSRWSWIALGAGLAGWSGGEVVWCYFEVVRRLPQTPFPSVADVGYLAFPVGAAAGLVLFPKGGWIIHGSGCCWTG